MAGDERHDPCGVRRHVDGSPLSLARAVSHDHEVSKPRPIAPRARAERMGPRWACPGSVDGYGLGFQALCCNCLLS